jgi:osmotically-inducible protein OsmY
MRKVLVVLVLIAAIAGAGGYFAHTRGWNIPFIGSTEDAATTAKVKTALALSKTVSAYDLEVTTEAGVVTLTGRVPSETAKSLAGEIARDVKGVAEVRNEIAVDPTAQPSSESMRVEDLEIKTAILEAFARSPELAGKRIDVRVDNRMVTLSGAVETTAQRNGAEQTARAAQGVAGVTNDLVVTDPLAATETLSPKPIMDPDSELSKRVEFELYRTGAFDTQTLRIRAESGTLTLSGTVRSRAEQLLAERIAQSAEGVGKVVNELKVAQPRGAKGQAGG